MCDTAFHLSRDALLRLREDRLDNARRLRTVLHLSRCRDCVRKAGSLPTIHAEPLAEEPLAQTLRRLAEPASWPVLGAAHVEALEGVETAPGGFLNLLLEEAVVLALERGTLEVFSLPMVAAEICVDLMAAESWVKLRRRTLIRRGDAAAALGFVEAAKTSLEHAATVGPEIEDAALDADLLEACGRFLGAIGGDAGGRYISARHYARGAKVWLRELELHLAGVGPDVDDADGRRRAIEALEEARRIEQKIPRDDILRRRTALMTRSTFAAELAASCQRHSLDPPTGLDDILTKLDETRWIDEAGVRAIGRRDLSRGHLLLALGEADAAREAFLRAIEAYTHAEASQLATAAFLGLVQHHRAETEQVLGEDLDRLFKLVEDRLGPTCFHRFMSLLVTSERVRKITAGAPRTSDLALAS